MRERESGEHPLGWVPPLVAGLGGVVVAETGAGLLLYAGGGFLQALTLVLAVLFGSFALGLGVGGARAVEDPVEQLRLRWVGVLLSVLLAAVAAGAWSVVGGFAGAALAQGLGLAFLVALPLYAFGGLLGAMGAARAAADVSAPGAWAAAGAGVGVVLSGLFLLPSLTPPSILTLALVGLSGAALVHGSVLDRRTIRRVVERAESPWGPVVVEEVAAGSRAGALRVLENGRLRGGREKSGAALLGWEAAAPRFLPAGPVVVFAGAAATLARHLASEGREVELLDRNPVLLEMSRRHLDEAGDAPGAGDPPGAGEADGPRPLLAALSRRPRASLAAVVLDAAALAPGDPFPDLPPSTLWALASALTPEGVVVIGHPAATGVGWPEPLRSRLQAVFPRIEVRAQEDGTALSLLAPRLPPSAATGP